LLILYDLTTPLPQELLALQVAPVLRLGHLTSGLASFKRMQRLTLVTPAVPC